MVRELVERRASAGQRGRRGGDRGQLLTCGELSRGVEAVSDRGRLVLRRSHERFEDASDRAATVVACREGRRRHHARHPARRRAELAQGCATAQAGPHVRAQHREVLGGRLAIGQRREHRLVSRAVGAALDPGHPPQERPPPLREQPVHLRVRPPRHRADLAVGEALRLQHQRPDLVRLQVAERLGALAQTLESLGLLVRDATGGGPVAELTVVGDGRVAFALAPQREGLVLHHGLEPRDQLLLARRGRLRQEDLEAALARVLGVLGRGRVAACRREDLGSVPSEQLEGRRIDLGALRPDAPRSVWRSASARRRCSEARSLGRKVWGDEAGVHDRSGRRSRRASCDRMGWVQ